MKRAYKIDGFVEPLSCTLEKKIHWSFLTSSLMMKSTRSPRMILDKVASSTQKRRMLKPALVNSWKAHPLKRPKKMFTVQSTACCEKKRKMVLEFDHCENWNVLHNRFLNSERATISFYVQTPNEVVNRNSVAHQWRTQKMFMGGFHSVAYGGHLCLVCAVCDVTIWRHIHVFKPSLLTE